MIKDILVKAISEATGIMDVELSIPENSDFGDFTTNIALRAHATVAGNIPGVRVHKQVTAISGPNPRKMAENLKDKLEKNDQIQQIVEKIEIAGPGFLNLWLKKDVLIDVLIQIDNQKDDYGSTDQNKGKLAIIEYSSPNIAKPFSIGHFRSTIIGDAVGNLLEATGWKVLRDNHLGDWGTQFGKQIYAIKTWGNESELEKSKNPVKDLVALYVKFHEEAEKDSSLDDKARELFKKLEDGDPKTRKLWQKCVDWSWIEFRRIYKELGVSFSKEFNDGRGLGESFFESRMPVIIEELEKKGLLKEGKEGARLVFFDHDKYPPAMILKKDGATLYHTRDLATDKFRLDKFNPELVINEVGLEQKLYFEQLFEMERLLGWYTNNQRVHVGHGLVRFKEGKMSTRKGNTIELEQVLSEAKERAKKLGSDSSELAGMVGIGALKWNDLKRDPKTDIVFDWDEMLNMNGNSGPYLQYTYARAHSVLAKVKTQKSKLKSDNLLTEKFGDSELKVVRKLAQLPEVIANAAKNYSPNLLANYLYILAQSFNNFYNSKKIIGSPEEGERVAMTAGVANVLKKGLNLLGIQAPERM